MKRPKRRSDEKLLRAVHPNAGLEARYRRALVALVKEMCDSVEWWVTAAYRKAKPIVAEQMAQDDAPPVVTTKFVGGSRPWEATIDGEALRTSAGAALRFATEENARNAARRLIGELLPADELTAVMKDLADDWLARFDVSSNRLAKYFATSAAKRTDDALKNALRAGGFLVNFQASAAVLDITRAAITENVALIRSIPQQYFKNIEGMVMRSVQRGGELSTLTNDLQKQFGVTRRRAVLIARDQNRKATAVIQEARRREIGIKEAIWMHSGAGKEPRPTHVAMNGKKYKVNEGMYDPAEGRNVFPGSLINCRCTSRAVIPTFFPKDE